MCHYLNITALNCFKHILKRILLLILLSVPLFSQSQVRVSGFVKDSISSEVLVGAHIIDTETNRAVTTDNNGYFSIVLKKSNTIKVTFVGYTERIVNINSTQDTLIQVLLSAGREIDEVVVAYSKRPSFNVSTLSQIELQKIPSLGAKPDVMKSIQLLPGIQNQGEGSSLVLVRGGNPGENLYLFDNVALIYVNHLGGLMSVFNPDMINNIDIYKGGFPSKYGGKLSSIMDIAQREGNSTYLKGALSIGLTDASFLIEGPTPLENSTFLLTGRKTLVDPLMALASKLTDGGDYIASYGFHDINGKFTWRPDHRNTLSLNLYQGDDYLNFWYKSTSFSSTEKARMANLWGNWLLSARWNRVHSPKLFSTQNLSYVRYRLSDRQKYSYSSIDEGMEYGRKYLSSVQDVSYKWGWKAELNRSWNLDFGLQTSFLQHRPNSITLSGQQNASSETIINSFESAIYLDNNWTVSNWLKVRAGARGVNYSTKGYSVFELEPRANVDFNVSQNHTINLSYMDVNQFSHLLFTAGSIMSNEVWVPAGNDIEPASSRQVSAGWQGTFNWGMFNAEVNVYHKTLKNLSTYQEGYTNLMGDGNWRNKVESGGSGEAFGAEFFLRKNHGAWTGFLSYTLSKATRQYDNMNNGVEFLFDYHKPHSIAISINRKLSDKLSLNAAWVFESGLPFTPVIGKRFITGVEYEDGDDPFLYEAFIYGERNSERMRPYHRLDLALHYTTYSKRSGYKTQWTFSVYNAYNRKNPYSYYYTHGNYEQAYMIPSPSWSSYEPFSLYQISYFPIIPTLSYKIFFDKNQRKDLNRKSKKPLLRRILYH